MDFEGLPTGIYTGKEANFTMLGFTTPHADYISGAQYSLSSPPYMRTVHTLI